MRGYFISYIGQIVLISFREHKNLRESPSNLAEFDDNVFEVVYFMIGDECDAVP